MRYVRNWSGQWTFPYNKFNNFKFVCKVLFLVTTNGCLQQCQIKY